MGEDGDEASVALEIPKLGIVVKAKGSGKVVLFIVVVAVAVSTVAQSPVVDPLVVVAACIIGALLISAVITLQQVIRRWQSPTVAVRERVPPPSPPPQP